MKSQKILHVLLAFCLSFGCQSSSSAQSNSNSWTPFSYQLEYKDALKFAELFKQSKGRPTETELFDRYLTNPSRGIEIFTPGRIENAAHLAKVVAKYHDDYAYAIDTCLPLLDSLNHEMRSVYLGLHGLLPERQLPAVFVVFGAANSGGTAAADAQVLGLEVACKKGTQPEQFKQFMRMMFAHETVHSLQGKPQAEWMADPLLVSALAEGGADYIAGLVLGRVPDPERDTWARSKESELWKTFAQDRMTVKLNTKEAMNRDSTQGQAFYRWFANAGSPPSGWHYEAGYWIGRQIATQFIDKSKDKMSAIRRLLALEGPQGILHESGIDLNPR